MTEPIQMDIDAILKQLPHRYPFLLVDRVLECTAGQTIRALKNVTYNEPFFPGHFPHRPVMPGVMILEALAQTAGLLAFVTAGVVPDENTRFYFVGIPILAHPAFPIGELYPIDDHLFLERSCGTCGAYRVSRARRFKGL